MTTLFDPQSTTHPTWWRDVRVLKILLQVLFVVAVVVTILVLNYNLQVGLARSGLSLGFRFLRNSANFGITEGIPYQPSESYLKAFWVGVVNTIWVSAVSIVLAMVMGLILGMARLSANWLARLLATIVTELFRNIPVLLIIIFWYQAVLLPLPGVQNSYSLGGLFFVNQRGLIYTSLAPSWWLLPVLGLMALAFWGLRRLLRQQRPDWPIGRAGQMAVVGAILVGIALSLITPEAPLALDIPELTRFNFRGGGQFSAEFTALMLGLVTYTGAYIAEVVRGAFLAVPRGQWEASRAIGLSEFGTFRLVVVPQALRIMLPSLNTQFVTLIKNSSLAIAVGYSDVFNVSSTIINQTGRSVEVFAMIMAAYLVVNLLVSLVMNLFNTRLKLVER